MITNLFFSLFHNFTYLKCRWISLLCETVSKDSKGELELPKIDTESIIIVLNKVSPQGLQVIKFPC
jgi:hypothetical protein